MNKKQLQEKFWELTGREATKLSVEQLLDDSELDFLNSLELNSRSTEYWEYVLRIVNSNTRADYSVVDVKVSLFNHFIHRYGSEPQCLGILKTSTEKLIGLFKQPQQVGTVNVAYWVVRITKGDRSREVLVRDIPYTQLWEVWGCDRQDMFLLAEILPNSTDFFLIRRSARQEATQRG